MMRPAWESSTLRLVALAAVALVLAACSGGSGRTNGTDGDVSSLLDSLDSEVAARWEAVCSEPLPPLSSEPLTAERFATATDGFDLMAGLAREGDLEGARAAFLSLAHDFTHDADGFLRASDEQLAKELCIVVALLEEEFARSSPDAATIAARAADGRDLLARAAGELGFGG